MTFKAADIRVTVGYIPISAFCLCAVLLGERFAAACLCALIHECGHLLFIYEKGCRTDIRLGVMCVDISDAKRQTRTAAQRAKIAAAGPLANLLTAPIFGAAYYLIGAEFFGLCAVMSAVLCVFNLLPVFSTDGGELLSLALGRYLSPRAVRCVLTALSVALLLPVFAAGFFLLLRENGSFTLLLAALSLICAVVKAAR